MKKRDFSRYKNSVDIEERKRVCRILRSQRRFLGITQDEVARQIGLSNTSYAKIERGESGVNMDRLSQIAKILQLDMVTLTDRSTEPIMMIVKKMDDMYKMINDVKNIVQETSPLYKIRENPQEEEHKRRKRKRK